ncbi:MAG: diguanylate cyclase [Clostridia bacterium]|nr:diguanylate cyclase [Clostridia bacterium]
MKHKHLSLTTKYIAIACTLLLVVNVILGVLLTVQSGNSMKDALAKHMLAVANTAASSVDGDFAASLTEDDVGSEEYVRVADTLNTIIDIQRNSDIKFIYLVKRVDGRYVFILDPDPDDPADYGEEVVTTPAQDTAWEGTAAIDPEPLEDEWGCFYTAWSPIYDSEGKVVSMVGVDFAADWYDAQIASQARTVIIASILSLSIGALIMFLLTVQLRRRFKTLNSELSVLSDDVGMLSEEIKAGPGYSAATANEEAVEVVKSSDTIGDLSVKVRNMQSELKDYITYMHAQAYTDSMTGSANKTAYLEKIKEINSEINAGDASFAVVVFDVNGLKSTNDNFGHECGDRIITDTAEIIRRVFPGTMVYRIGGDEFIAVVEGMDRKELEERFAKLDEEIDHFNREEKKYSMTLSFSYGGSVYRPGEDAAFKAVFKRADEEMYKNKAKHYDEMQ